MKGTCCHASRRLLHAPFLLLLLLRAVGAWTMLRKLELTPPRRGTRGRKVVPAVRQGHGAFRGGGGAEQVHRRRDALPRARVHDTAAAGRPHQAEADGTTVQGRAPFAGGRDCCHIVRVSEARYGVVAKWADSRRDRGGAVDPVGGTADARTSGGLRRDDGGWFRRDVGGRFRRSFGWRFRWRHCRGVSGRFCRRLGWRCRWCLRRDVSRGIGR